MPKHSQPRRGSLQFWPRKRAEKSLPSVNWKEVCKRTDKKGFLGFIGYKVGMSSGVVKDNTEHSLTKGQRIIFPVTFVECPPLRILSVRFYKNGKVAKEAFVGTEKDLKHKIKIGKKKEKIDLEFKDYDSIRILAYSLVSRTAIKKSPDLIEIGLGGSKEEQLATAKEFLSKEIQIDDVFKEGLVDVRGVTKGKGLQGPAKRYGISLRAHKSEKGVRKVGSIGPWHPARITFRVPMAGQTGYFSRVVYNSKIIGSGKIVDKDINPSEGFKHYGKIKTSYLILKGSVQGPAKRQIVLTSTIRPTKRKSKRNMELIKIEK
jgi:large subunit ribosomal protein L3